MTMGKTPYSSIIPKDTADSDISSHRGLPDQHYTKKEGQRKTSEKLEGLH